MRGRIEGKATGIIAGDARRRRRNEEDGRESEGTSVFLRSRAGARPAERRRNNWHSARTSDRGTKGRGQGGNDDAGMRERGGCHGGMHLCIAAIYDAELWRFSPRTVAVRYVRYVPTYVYDRISTSETNSISGTVRVRSSVRPSVRPSVRTTASEPERARSQTAPRDKLIVREACA